MEKHTEFGPLVMEEIGKTWIQLCLSKNHTLNTISDVGFIAASNAPRAYDAPRKGIISAAKEISSGLLI